MTPAEDAHWQGRLAGAITRAIPGAVVTFTIADDVCEACGHQHAGPEVGGICVGCACPGPAADDDAAELALREAERDVVQAASAWEYSCGTPWVADRLEELGVAVRSYRKALNARIEECLTRHAQS